MFLKDPFAIGPAVPLSDERKADLALDAEWDAAGKPSIEQSIEDRNRFVSDAMKRALGEK